MKNIRPRYCPSLPGISSFPEFNIRLYVTAQGQPGVFFLTLDAQSRITTSYAPFAYSLPYVYAKGHVCPTHEGGYRWEMRRQRDDLEFAGHTTPKGPLRQADKDSLEDFLFERYCFYTLHQGRLHRAYTCHAQWSFQDGTATLASNSFTEHYKLGISTPLQPELVHVTKGVDVQTWGIEAAF